MMSNIISARAMSFALVIGLMGAALPAFAQASSPEPVAGSSAAPAPAPAPAAGAGDPNAGGRGFGRKHRGGGQFGKGDPAARAARKAKIMQKFDTNGDGKLDYSERAQFKAFREQRRAQRAAKRGAGGPGGFNGAQTGGQPPVN